MTVRYADHVDPAKTPQSEPLDARQVANNAGGYVYAADKWQRLTRFLILGSDGGTFYAGERALTRENAAVVDACCAENASRTVDLIAAVSIAGRAPKNDPAILALAIVAASTSVDARRLAYAALPEVCRIPTHLLHFLAYCKPLRGWSRGLRRAVAEWYGRWSVDQLAFELLKYQQRDGWANRDALRLSHAKIGPEKQAAIRWAVDGFPACDSSLGRIVKRKNASNRLDTYEDHGRLPEIIHAYEAAKADVEKIDASREDAGLLTVACERRHVERIRQFGLTREMLPTEALGSRPVWEALLEKMPSTALIRNLGKMTAIGLVAPGSTGARDVVGKLSSLDYIRKGRVHPLTILQALAVYANGHGEKGSLRWQPVQDVLDALDAAFYASFGNVETTGRRIRLAVDISGSMSAPIAGMSIDCRTAAAALALVTKAVEPRAVVSGFTTGPYPNMHGPQYNCGLTELPISPRMRLSDVVSAIARLPMGGTNCAVPMQEALVKDDKVDAFVILTDNETWHGPTHPAAALKAYRKTSGIDAQLVVVAMTPTEFSIADPADLGMLDVVGFDTATPAAIAAFIS